MCIFPYVNSRCCFTHRNACHLMRLYLSWTGLDTGPTRKGGKHTAVVIICYFPDRAAVRSARGAALASFVRSTVLYAIAYTRPV